MTRIQPIETWKPRTCHSLALAFLRFTCNDWSISTAGGRLWFSFYVMSSWGDGRRSTRVSSYLPGYHWQTFREYQKLLIWKSKEWWFECRQSCCRFRNCCHVWSFKSPHTSKPFELITRLLCVWVPFIAAEGIKIWESLPSTLFVSSSWFLPVKILESKQIYIPISAAQNGKWRGKNLFMEALQCVFSKLRSMIAVVSIQSHRHLVNVSRIWNAVRYFAKQ
jgi:hypothetical protein